MLTRSRWLHDLGIESLGRRELLTGAAELVSNMDVHDYEVRYRTFAEAGDDTYQIVQYEGEADTEFTSDGRTGDGIPRTIKFAGRVFHHGVVADELYVASQDGRELWKTDGTEAGTTRLLSVGRDKYVRNLIAVNDKLYFTAGRDELWVTDGTGEGTTRLLAIGEKHYLDIKTPLDDRLYFTVEGKVWVTDGTKTGTQPVKGNFRLFASSESQLFLRAENGELWRTDGTDQGTYPLPSAKQIRYATVVGDRIFYLAGGRPGMTPNGKLWVSDGTLEGTHELTDVNLVPSGFKHGCGRIDGFAAGDSLYFLAMDEEGNVPAR